MENIDQIVEDALVYLVHKSALSEQDISTTPQTVGGR